MIEPPLDVRDLASFALLGLVTLVAVAIHAAILIEELSRCTRLDCAECRRAARRLWGLS